MHLQSAVDGFEVFARSLSIGAETMVMRFEPDRPLHDRYQVDHEFLDADTGRPRSSRSAARSTRSSAGSSTRARR